MDLFYPLLQQANIYIHIYVYTNIYVYLITHEVNNVIINIATLVKKLATLVKRRIHRGYYHSVLCFELNYVFLVKFTKAKVYFAL